MMKIWSAWKVNRYGDTMDDMLRQVSDDVARFGGFALHINYNVLGQVAEVNFMPFEQCRLEETDDAGVVSHILQHVDWKGKRTKNGKTEYLDDKHIKKFNVFNPDPIVVMKEIEDCGDIDCYNGQVLWVSVDGKYQYPTPIYMTLLLQRLAPMRA